ncbi:hypothetical protein CCACVL1_28903 [Corchorus capsularis]|uniref:Uncharacterized protein n=1 Tax=Corchorus capsularis TaxID=210143 RepID=A0A1R3G4T1_COCAP|nr:hypothetical protein CCACVL1_28903 [Corchorus capsularis]
MAARLATLAAFKKLLEEVGSETDRWSSFSEKKKKVFIGG